MNKQTLRILRQAVLIVEDFERGEHSLAYTVAALEGSLRAIEEKLPQTFMKNWYEHWGSLEEINATQNSDGSGAVDPIQYARALKAEIESSIKTLSHPE